MYLTRRILIHITNAFSAADFVAMEGVEPLVCLAVDGTQEQKLHAAGTLGYLDPDLDAALLVFIRNSTKDNDKMEGLVALQILCHGGNEIVCTRLEAVGGITILSQTGSAATRRSSC